MADLKGEKPLIDAPPSYETTPAKSRPPPPPPQLRPPLPLDLPLINHLRSKRVILASASPRRRQLLAQIGLTNLEIHPSPLPEDLPKQTLSPFEYVAQTSERKALAVYSSLLNNPTGNTAAPTNGNNDASGGTYQRLKPPPDPSLVISADTIILHPPTGTILEKPTSESHHISMLNTLLSPAQNPTRSHKVYTAITVLAPLTSARDPGYAVQTHVEETTVRFAKDVTEEVVKAYVRTREGADKAGGYAIQGLGGALLVDGIDGSWDNVVGLPVRKTLGLVEKVLNEADDEGGGGAFEDDDDDNDEGEGEGDSGDEEGDDRKNA